MTSEEYTGYSIDDAKELILMLIESRPGIRPRSMETHLVRKKGQSTTGISRAMLYRALESLEKDGLIECEKAKGKRAVSYFLKGRRPSIVRAEDPSRFDEFVVGECERMLREMIDARVLFSPPSANGDALEAERAADIESRSISTYQLIAAWEEMRGQSIRRPWSSDVHEFVLGINLVQIKTSKWLISYNTRKPSVMEWFNFYTNAIDQISRLYISKNYKR